MFVSDGGLMSESVLVTGANGFLGGALLRVLSTRNGTLFAGVRDERQYIEAKGVKSVVLGDLSKIDGEAVMLPNFDVVIHCAARVHVMNDASSSPLADFRSVNVEGTLSLARLAAQAGVKRFVFISSVKVNGERTDPDMPFIEDDLPFPEDPYGVSKREAEEGLRTLADTTGMAVVIIRPPLVYGPGVKGNFLNLLKLARSGLPLPLGSIQNRRSMIYLGNLIDLIVKCIDHPAAVNQTFLASDGRDLSTTELLQLLRRAMKLPVWLLPVPQSLLQLLGRLSGRAALIDRLCGSLQVDIHKARALLDWTPPYKVEDGIRETVSYFMSEKQGSA